MAINGSNMTDEEYRNLLDKMLEDVKPTRWDEIRKYFPWWNKYGKNIHWSFRYHRHACSYKWRNHTITTIHHWDNDKLAGFVITPWWLDVRFLFTNFRTRYSK